MKNIKNKQLMNLLLVLFLGFALIAGLILVRQRYQKPKAVAAPPALSFSVVPPGLTGGDFDLMININPHDTPFNAFTAVFAYNDKVQLRNTANIESNFEKLYTSDFGLMELSASGNRISVTGAKTGTSFSGTVIIPLIKVKMKTVGTGGNAIFTWQTGTAVEDRNIDKQDGNFPIGSAEAAKLYFNSEKKTPVRDDPLDVDLYLDTNGAQVNSVQVSFIYDAKLSPRNTAGDNIILNPNSGFNTSGVIKTIDASTRTVLLALATNTTVTGNNIKLATVLFQTGTQLGEVKFQADQTNSKVYVNTQNILTDRPQYSITIQETAGVTPTPTVTGAPATPTPTATLVAATPTPTVTGVLPQPTSTPTVTPTPIFTLTPTPGAGEEPYRIAVGEKQSLTIQIAAGVDPQIAFKFKLANVETTPDLFVKLRVKDDLAFLENPNLVSSCNTPGAGEKDFYIPVRAEGGIYRPVSQIGIDPPDGAVVPPISSDNKVTLTGVVPGKFYTMILKGPKTRGTKMIEHIKLQAGFNASQLFYWAEDSKLDLQPGDLPDPNNDSKQDCTVNSVDLSLITALLPPPGTSVNYIACCSSLCSRIYNATCPDWNKMLYADVNYDGVVNGADVADVVTTLSTKPDDDL